MKTMANQYKKPKIKEIIEYICEQNNLNLQSVVADIGKKFPQLFNRERCANCDASMVIYEHRLDTLDLLLLQGMGRIFKENYLKSKDFTESNKVHIQSQLNDYYSVPSRSTQCRFLGLIAKVKDKDTGKQISGTWCITRRGFDCLMGKEVPKSVYTFRNRIVKHGEELATMHEIYDNYKGKDYKDELKKYNKSSWYNVDSFYPSDFLLETDDFNDE